MYKYIYRLHSPVVYFSLTMSSKITEIERSASPDCFHYMWPHFYKATTPSFLHLYLLP